MNLWNVKKTKKWKVLKILRLHIGVVLYICWFRAGKSSESVCVCWCAACIWPICMDLTTSVSFLKKIEISWTNWALFLKRVPTHFSIELVFSIFVGNAIFKSPCFMSTSLFLSANFSSWFIDACIVNWADRTFNSPISNLSDSCKTKKNILYKFRSAFDWWKEIVWQITMINRAEFPGDFENPISCPEFWHSNKQFAS